MAHQAHSGGRWGPRRRSGPWQTVHRAGVRHRSQASLHRVAGARCLHEHRSRLHGIAQQVERLGRHPGRACAGVAFEVPVGVAGDVHGDALAYDVTRCDYLGGPPGPEEVLRLHAASVRRQHGGAAGLLRAHQEHLAGVGVRRPRLVVQVVTVVPDRYQAEVLHRREHGCSGADHDAHGPAPDRQEGAVALGRAGVRRQHDVAALAHPLGERGVEAGHVAMVGHADQRSPAGAGRRDHGLGQHLGPVVAGQDRPDGPGRLPRRQPLQHPGPCGIAREVVGTGGPADGGRRLGRLLLDGRMTRRDGQAEDVRADAGVPRGHGAGQCRDIRREHALRADHPAKRLEPAGVLGGRRPLDHEAVDVLTGEPHLHPHPRLRFGAHRLGHGVVEGPVEMGERDVDEHPGDRVHLGLGDGLLLLGRLDLPRLGLHPLGCREQRRLLLLTGRHTSMLSPVGDMPGRCGPARVSPGAQCPFGSS